MFQSQSYKPNFARYRWYLNMKKRWKDIDAETQEKYTHDLILVSLNSSWFGFQRKIFDQILCFYDEIDKQKQLKKQKKIIKQRKKQGLDTEDDQDRTDFLVHSAVSRLMVQLEANRAANNMKATLKQQTSNSSKK